MYRSLDQSISISSEASDTASFLAKMLSFYVVIKLIRSFSSFLVRPEAIACGAGFCFTADVYLFFISTRDL